jgi:acetyl esterase/lipase
MMKRGEFLQTLAGAAIARSLYAQQKMPSPETLVYKVVQDHEIKLDVYRPGEKGARPGVLWIHGGALINGSRKQLSNRMLAGLLKSGYVIVSIDYRLAPETKLPGIIEDLQDAWRWMRTEGSSRFGIDPGRIAVAGGSAGGYLTLMSGFCLEPRPRALVSYYGYGPLPT